MGAHAGQTREANDLAKAAREIADPVERDHAVDEARKLDPDYGSIGVVLDGNLESEPPTPEQRKALEDLLAYLKTEYRIPLDRIMGHKHVKTSVTEGRGLEFAGKCETDDPHFCTLCPGHEGERLLHTVSDALPADSDEAKKKLAR